MPSTKQARRAKSRAGSRRSKTGRAKPSRRAKRPLRIGMYAHNLEKFPPEERIMAHYTVAELLTNGLAERGHDVTLFAARDSRTKARLVSFDLPSLYASRYRRHFTRAGEPARTTFEHFFQSRFIGEMVTYLQKHQDRFDLIHLHSIQQTAHVSKLLSIPTVYTMHDPIDQAMHSMLEMYKQQENFHLVSISDNQRQLGTDLSWLGTVHNGIDLSLYKFRPDPEPYLMFAGRMNEDKGPHRAIAAAKEAGVPIKLFGPYNSHGVHKVLFWKREVEPHLCKDVSYEGYLPHGELAGRYGKARALLMPINWEEPFGLVSIEAMASGTPVIGFRRGSLPEIIEDGVTGFLVDTVEEMAEAIQQLDTIDRAACRARVEKLFAADRMVTDYEAAYESALAGR